ncbi:MAG: CARDB domain-containing protein [Deltaproteobacteria bacterium]
MKRQAVKIALGVFFLFGTLPLAAAGTIYQNFEPENAGSIVNVGTSAVQGVDRTEAVHLGRYAVKSMSPFYWTGVGVYPRQDLPTLDLQETNNDRLTFWAYALPDRTCYVYGCDPGTDNNVGVTLYDNGLYTAGFEVWTTQKARYGRWTKLKVLFSQLPSDFDMRHVTRIDFKNYWPGTYYIDDIQAQREDRVYQSFEIEERSGSTDDEYGWKWNPDDTAGVSTAGDPVKEGAHSWKLVSTQKWGGTGIQSQEKQLVIENDTAQQSFWHVHLDPENNDRLTFWVYGLPDSGMDNNVAVQFYGFNPDGTPFTDDQKAVVWTKETGRAGHWSRLTALFSDVLAQNSAFDFTNINKLQFQFYWPGTYYLDDIRATGPQPVLKESGFGRGVVSWDPVAGATNYRLQESTSGPEGGWVTVYSGPQTSFTATRLSKSWYRVRWEEDFTDRNSLPYASDWSRPAAYLAPAVCLNYKDLQSGRLTWNGIPQAQVYEVQSGPSKYGPWTSLYKGPASPDPLDADTGAWYRVRALREEGPDIVDIAPWSRPQTYDPGKGFVTAEGTVIKDADGNGDELVLNGVNLGGLFVIEPWMTGLGTSDDPPLEDDWSIRQALAGRFAPDEAEALLKAYQEAYVNTFDFDKLLEMGVTLVRLPFYYRNLQDDDGNWIRDDAGNIDFGALDRIVDALSDRGIYVLLDMHGAPGLQSAEATTGRKDFNKLFAEDGEVYRERTVDMWTRVAEHYKDNPWVLGYDLLNEPIGAAPYPALLADLYDRIYKAIRTVDARHLIVMEGMWYPDPTDPEPDPAKKREVVDWDTLPVPATMSWTNVMYEFHFYLWGHDEDVIEHEIFINRKTSDAALKQPVYDVPVLIGEFYGFNIKTIWEYYIANFSSRKWSWTSWTYKFHPGASTWGLFGHVYYDEQEPAFRSDAYDVLERKLAKYATADYHAPTETLQEIMEESGRPLAPYPADRPYISDLSALFVGVYQPTLTVTGRNFGAAQGDSTLDYPYGTLSVIKWSDTSILAQLLNCVPPDSGPVTVTTSQGTSNGIDIVTSPLPSGADTGFIGTTEPGGFAFKGKGLGDTPGRFQFYPKGCNPDIPPFHPCNNGDAAISFWSDTLIEGYVPPDALDTGSRYNIFAQHGGDLYPTMIPEPNQPPVLDAIGDKTVEEGQTLTFTVSASDPDGDPLVYEAAGLPAGAVFSGQTFAWTPSYYQAGAYNVTFSVTDGKDTAQETIAITVNNVALPDLVLTALSTPAANLLPGDAFAVSCTVGNQGTATAGAFDVVFHLSRDAAFGGGDDIALPAAFSLQSLNAGKERSKTLTFTVAAGTPPGTYHVCGRADGNNAVLEENESNNDRATDTVITIASAAGAPDLAMTALSGPASAARGETVVLHNSVINEGTGAAGGFYVGLYLSAKPGVKASDKRIGQRYVGGLAAGASDTADSPVTLPDHMGRGTYYFGAIADDTAVVEESDENNNALTGNSVVIR